MPERAQPMTRGRLIAAVVVVVIVIVGWLLWPNSGSDGQDSGQAPTSAANTARARATASRTSSGGGSVDPTTGLRWVELATLPTQAQQTVSLIEAGGPFPYSRDGIVFGNREGLLPTHASGWYHEYTVKTPGESDRGARRIVTGGAKGATVDTGLALFYSDDHYDSFRRIRLGAG